MVEAGPCEGDTLNTNNGITRHVMVRAEKPNCLLVTEPVSAPTTSQVPSEAHPCEMVILICIKYLSCPFLPHGSLVDTSRSTRDGNQGINLI